MPPEILTEASLLASCQILAERDADLAEILTRLGPPPLWAREPGFSTLVYIILEQQVSLASARAAFQRLAQAVNPLTPQGFLLLEDEQLREIGFSRQKMGYVRGLAAALVQGQINLTRLASLDEETVRAELTRIKGIGHWSADIYLMEALLRPDIWPSGDLALSVTVQRVKHLPGLTPAALEEIGEQYRPWRAVAARMFWHHYLNKPS